MKFNLENKTAVVTGAGRGIGRAISLMLAEAGADVVLTARTAEEIKSAASEIRAGGGTAIAVTADISREKDVDDLFTAVNDQLGAPDILINNAGLGIYGPLVDFPVSDFDKVMAVNLRGTFLCCQHAMQLMIPEKTGYIINISSVVGFKGYPNQTAYTASKHGIMGITKSLAKEAQEHGIRVSAVLPGGVDTDMVKISRPDLDPSILLQPEDVARTVQYLLSLSGHAAVDQIYIRRSSGQPF
jgi:NAD(P)-dependent dehydrogenase (short-subunit alcohol dehydrogenase family)